MMRGGWDEQREQEPAVLPAQPVSHCEHSDCRTLAFNLKQRPPYITCDYAFTVIVNLLLRTAERDERRRCIADAADRVPSFLLPHHKHGNNPLAPSPLPPPARPLLPQ